MRHGLCRSRANIFKTLDSRERPRSFAHSATVPCPPGCRTHAPDGEGEIEDPAAKAAVRIYLAAIDRNARCLLAYQCVCAAARGDGRELGSLMAWAQPPAARAPSSSSCSRSPTRRAAALRPCSMARVGRLQEVRWREGALLPPGLKDALHPREVDFFKEYAGAVTDYMAAVGMDLTSVRAVVVVMRALRPPALVSPSLAHTGARPDPSPPSDPPPSRLRAHAGHDAAGPADAHGARAARLRRDPDQLRAAAAGGGRPAHDAARGRGAAHPARVGGGRHGAGVTGQWGTRHRSITAGMCTGAAHRRVYSKGRAACRRAAPLPTLPASAAGRPQHLRPARTHRASERPRVAVW